MTEPRSIKLISANARRAVKYKSTIAVFVIWLFSLLAMVFIFFDNKDFIKMPLLQDTVKSISVKQQPANTNGGDSTESESFVLVQYNKKLILTKYSALSGKAEADSAVQNTLSAPNEYKPVIIKRPKNNQQKENDGFFIKTVPQ
jgi:hypothetical protein